MVVAVSILFAASGVLLAVWWAVTNRPQKVAGFAASLIAIFAGAVLLVRSSIVELSSENVGTIQQAAARATADAEAIRDLRVKIDAQARAAVDLVAASRRESKRVAAETSTELAEAKRRLAELNKLAARGDPSLQELESGRSAAESQAGSLEPHVVARDLSANQVEVLATSLRASGAHEITLTTALNDSEAIEFAGALKKAIEAGGWTVHVSQAVWPRSVSGLQILAPVPFPAHATTLISALGRAGLQPKGLSRQRVEKLEVLVGKPGQ